MTSFQQFLEAEGFQADACESTTDPDFYALAERLWEADQGKGRLIIAQQAFREYLCARMTEMEALLRRVDIYFQHTGKVGDLPVSVHALLADKLTIQRPDGTETTVTPLPMWQP